MLTTNNPLRCLSILQLGMEAGQTREVCHTCRIQDIPSECDSVSINTHTIRQKRRSKRHHVKSRAVQLIIHHNISKIFF
jgi:hypothetical protein